jgi:hypothetical protein
MPRLCSVEHVYSHGYHMSYQHGAVATIMAMSANNDHVSWDLLDMIHALS